jgi:hypothetical protein
LYCAADGEINSIVTVGVPLATLAFPKMRTRGRDLHLPSKVPTGKNNAFRLAHLPATISRLPTESSPCTEHLQVLLAHQPTPRPAHLVGDQRVELAEAKRDAGTECDGFAGAGRWRTGSLGAHSHRLNPRERRELPSPLPNVRHRRRAGYSPASAMRRGGTLLEPELNGKRLCRCGKYHNTPSVTNPSFRRSCMKKRCSLKSYE